MSRVEYLKPFVYKRPNLRGLKIVVSAEGWRGRGYPYYRRGLLIGYRAGCQKCDQYGMIYHTGDWHPCPHCMGHGFGPFINWADYHSKSPVIHVSRNDAQMYELTVVPKEVQEIDHV